VENDVGRRGEGLPSAALLIDCRFLKLDYPHIFLNIVFVYNLVASHSFIVFTKFIHILYLNRCPAVPIYFSACQGRTSVKPCHQICSTDEIFFWSDVYLHLFVN
jgi:hypothetical protein